MSAKKLEKIIDQLNVDKSVSIFKIHRNQFFKYNFNRTIYNNIDEEEYISLSYTKFLNELKKWMKMDIKILQISKINDNQQDTNTKVKQKKRDLNYIENLIGESIKS